MSEKKKKPDDEKARQSLLNYVRKVTGIKEDDDTLSFASEYIAIKDVISTGSREMDQILTPLHFEQYGVGGLPRGFLITFYGPQSGGKTSFALGCSKTVTMAKGFVFWADAEGSLVPEWLREQGVDDTHVIRMGTGLTGEEYLEKVIALAESGRFPLLVLDSVTAMRPKKLLEQGLDENQIVGAGAQMMSRACPMLVSAAKKGNAAIVLINQIRNKVGMMYGNPECEPYGEAAGFYSSLRVRFQQVGSRKARGIMRGDEEIGIRSAAHVVKSRFGPPHKEAVVPFYYKKDVKPYPFDRLLDLAMENKLIKCRSRKIESGEPVQHFSLDGSEELKGIAGFDDFKDGLLDRKDLIKSIAERLEKEKNVPLDPEVKEYISSLDKSTDPLDEGFQVEPAVPVAPPATLPKA